MRLTFGSGSIVRIILIGLAAGFALHILCSLLGYAIRECIKFFKIGK